jgi:lipopolysaccharide export system protein LptC
MAHFVNDPRSGQLVHAAAAVPAVPARSRLDAWAERERPRVDTAGHYSRFVRIMKITLPLVAFSLVVLVVAYSTTSRESGNVRVPITELTALDNDRQLVAPKLTGTDGRGQPFTVTAKGATQVGGKARKMEIDEVVADITMQDRSWVQVGAVQGLLDVEGKTLDLTQTINIYSDKGYECHTDAARYDFGSGLLKGQAPIACQGPMGLINAKEFEGLRDPGILRFMGGVSTTYYPTPREGTAKDAAETNPEGIAEPLPDGGTEAGVDAAYVPNPNAPAPVQPKPKPQTP